MNSRYVNREFDEKSLPFALRESSLTSMCIVPHV